MDEGIILKLGMQLRTNPKKKKFILNREQIEQMLKEHMFYVKKVQTKDD